VLVSAAQSKWVAETVELDAISRLPFISTYSSVTQQLEEGQLHANGIASRQIVLELGHPEAQKESVRRDLGVCFFRPSAVANDLSRGDLREVLTPGLELSIPLYIVGRAPALRWTQRPPAILQRWGTACSTTPAIRSTGASHGACSIIASVSL
jgi:DNA-binding transcriptional LysR family regulator